MRRWLKWQFVVPRVLLVVVAILTGQLVLGVVVRSAAKRLIARAIDERVDIGHARISLGGRKIVLDGVRVDSGHRHALGVLEADRCELNFDRAPLAHKRLVVESGRISGLRFGEAAIGRNESHDAESSAAKPSAWFTDDADLAARQWLDSMNEQFALDLVKQVGSVERTDAFCANWSKTSNALKSRLQELEDRATKLQESIKEAQVNPLRNDDTLHELRQEIAKLQKTSAEFRAEVDKLPDRLDAERRAIIAARRQDGELVNNRLHFQSIDAPALNAYFLREQTAHELNALVGGLRWMRQLFPATPTSGPRKKRGEDILFAGCSQEPGILIRSLQLEGTCRIGGQPVELRGVLTNLASQPRLYHEPMRLHFFGRGSMPLELQVTIDRSGTLPRDELLIDCQGMLLPAVALGGSDQFEMKLAPSVGSVSISVAVEGDRLTGDVQMVQHNVQITPAVHGPAGTPLCRVMGNDLSGINSMATRISLCGTLDKPKCSLWSNLGAAVAESMQRALRRAGDQHTRDLLAEADRRVDERLAEVDRQMAEQQQHIASETNDLTARLDELAASEKPLYRISAKEGGRRLPKDSLFR
ncbi:MAG TPA: hypothetical protein VFW73_03815 [Lacipirellulaceae bacterium]|nr:hypothetical protein [Lacipirellulaceae bacterium]